MVLYHKLFAQVVVSKRRGREFSIDELFAINITGRSTNKRKPYSRQTAEELLWLINNHLMPLKPANILEIGIASGGTSLIFAKIFPESQIFGIDLTDALLPNRLRALKNFHMIIGNSREQGTIKMLQNMCEKFDFILFDGDHSEEGIINDLKNFLPLLREGGLAVFHDIRHEPPTGIKRIYYSYIKKQLPDSFEYFIREDNNGYGLWYKPQKAG